MSLGPLEAKIQVFSGDLSENDRKSINERDHKFYCTPVIFECAVNFFFPTWKNVSGPYSECFSDIIGHREHPENTLKKGRKRVKEWCEVTFMKEWVKPPVHWLPAGVGPTPKPFSVSENGPFENFLRSNSTLL